jgi:hypothetical protein
MRARVDPWLLGVLAVGSLLYTWHLGWGLPNGNSSWAADAYGPITVLGLVQRSFREWNSGFFYFKYPLGYPFLLAATYAPVLGYLFLTGGWRNPRAEYPYGFEDPDAALFALGIAGRLLSVLFALGLVAAAYGIARRLLGLWAARLAAVLVATAYPVVYYAHTTNLDIGYVFWLIAALYFALVAAESESPMPWAALGVAAAMAVSAKEQGFAFLLPLPFLAVGSRILARRSIRECWSRCVIAMSVAALVTIVLANNVLFNPLGFVARIAYLLGQPLTPVEVRLAPVEFALWKGAKEWTYLGQLWDALDSALGTAVACAAVAGAFVVWRRRRAAIWLLVPAASYYYVSLRALDLITLRYTLPLMIVAALLTAGLLAFAAELRTTPAARRAVMAAAFVIGVLGLARSVELDWLLGSDSRYSAEAWMAAHLPPGSRGEIYQKPVYLPRFDSRWKVEAVPIAERSIDGLAARRPDFIVLSSASAKSISHTWNADWRTTRDLLAPRSEAVRFVDALLAGTLEYEPVIRFSQKPRLFRSRITSIAPEITIYARKNC